MAAFIKNVNQYQFFLLQKCLNLAFVFKLIPAIISDPEEKKLYLKKINNNKSNNKNIMYIYLTMILVFFRQECFCSVKRKSLLGRRSIKIHTYRVNLMFTGRNIMNVCRAVKLNGSCFI